MAEQQLDDAEVGAVIQEVRGERMAQHVRGEARGRDAGLGAKTLNSAQNACRVSGPWRAVTKSAVLLPPPIRVGRP